MADADSVPTATRAPITGATPKASTNRLSTLGDDGPAFPRLWQEIRAEVERRDLSGNYIAQLGIAPEDLIGAGTRSSLVACPLAGTSWLSATRPLSFC